MAGRQRRFRVAADVLTKAFAALAEVERVALIGSVVRPLEKEIPRFRDFRRAGIAVWHECKDLDLAVRLGRLDSLRRTRAGTLRQLYDGQPGARLRRAPPAPSARGLPI